jgi:hypothetical protein
MSASSENPHLDINADQWIPALAKLYDSFANTLDPFAPERDLAEIRFYEQVATWHEFIDGPKPPLQEFQKGVIVRCIRYLNSPLNP